MSKKNLYFEDDCTTDKTEIKKHKAKKRKGKTFLTVIGIIILALTVFLFTVKTSNPDIDLTSLMPVKEIQNFISEFDFTKGIAEDDITTTQVTTTQPEYNAPEKIFDYMTFDEFDFNTSIQGNSIGNLLNGGLVGTDMTYEYHIVQGKGIYRFNLSTEVGNICYKSNDDLSSINLRGDYIYFVNDTTNELCKLKKGNSDAEVLAENVLFAYVYDTNIYYVTNTNAVYIMNVVEHNPQLIYVCEKGSIRFAGVSLSGVFFTVTVDNSIDYYYFDKKAQEISCFRESTENNDTIKLYLENGFMYYYKKQSNGEYYLCRQKFGSDKTVTLAENVNTQDFPVVDSNKVFYSQFTNETYSLIELNMNTQQEKTMLEVSSVKSDNDLKFFHGSEYDFIIGEKSSGNKVYVASSMLTSSTNVMKFNSAWAY